MASEKQKKYMEFFKKTLEQFGVDSPTELSDEKKKEFFQKINAGWKAENECKESKTSKLEKMIETIVRTKLKKSFNEHKSKIHEGLDNEFIKLMTKIQNNWPSIDEQNKKRWLKELQKLAFESR